MKLLQHLCPVCGYPGLRDAPHHSDDEGSFSYEICPCCGFEFGFTDVAEGIMPAAYRGVWVRQGMKWYSSSSPCPPDWDGITQVMSIPEDVVQSYNKRLLSHSPWQNPEFVGKRQA
jgi:hypothetical protein